VTPLSFQPAVVKNVDTRGERPWLDMAVNWFMDENDQDVFLADVLDAKGRPVASPVVWSSDNPDVVINAVTGKVTVADKAANGVAVITATVADVPHRVRLQIVTRHYSANAAPAAAPAAATK